MPSLYEPCGLNQMYSLRYGTLPIVRAVGGLRDTVWENDTSGGNGTGFVFTEPNAEHTLAAIKRGIDCFTNDTVLHSKAESNWECVKDFPGKTQLPNTKTSMLKP